MHQESPVLITIVAAVGFGLLAQVLAHRWRIPAIVLLVSQLAHDNFGIRLAYPNLKNPEKTASTKLLKQTGGKLAFGRPVDILAWEYTSGKIYKIDWNVPETWQSKMISEFQIPEPPNPFIRIRRNNTEVVHADQYWLPGDRVVFLSNLPSEKITDRLAVLVG